YFRRTLPLFIPSLLFTIIHRAVRPAVDAPAYVMRFDFTMLNTFWKYLVWARGVDHHTGLHLLPWMWPACTALILGGLAVFTIVKVRQGKKVALFFWVWFVILLIPVLP